MARIITACCLLLSVLGWAEERRADGFRNRLDRETLAALEAVERIEARLEDYRSLAPQERWRRESRMQRQLERLVDRCSGTRYENKALYYLAAWRMTFAEGEDVTPLLTRIRTGQHPSYKQLALVLQARHHLQQGRIPEARQLALDLVEDIPEFRPVLDLITLHEQVGRAAPRMSGTNLSGGPSDPVSEREEPWLLLAFIDLSDPEQRFRIETLVDEIGHRSYRDQFRLICISFDGNPLGAMNRLGEIGDGADLDLLWVNPNPEGDADTWRDGWLLPRLPVTVLIGPAPGRSIMAVDPQVSDLRQLVGRSRSSSNRGTGWGGIRNRRQRRWSD